MWEPLAPGDLADYGQPPAEDMDPEELERYESMAIERSNQVISRIEKAIAAWKASKEKPEDLSLRIRRLRYLHQALMRWERKALKSRKADAPERMGILREFCYIFFRYG